MPLFEIVIRTVGERTEDACIELVSRQKEAEEKLHVIRESTHAKAVESTIKVGLNSNAEWLLAIDADMLLIPDALAGIRKEMRACASSVAILHPAVADKLYRMKRWGLTVYRKSILSELNDDFQKIRKKQHLKIEGAAIKALTSRENRNIVFSKNVAAIHDFYQYYRDLYRKAYLNTLRNPGNIRKIEKTWAKLANSDDDYLVMSKAMDDAKNNEKKLTNSIADFDLNELEAVINELGLVEKSPLHWSDFKNQYSSESIESEIRMLSKHRIFNDYFEDTSLATRLREFVYKFRNV